MTTGNGVPTATDSGGDMYVRDGSRSLRDIEDLVDKLRIVTKQLAFPARTMPAQRPVYRDGTDDLAHAQLARPGEAGDPHGERGGTA
jgi:hypothetical protein